MGSQRSTMFSAQAHRPCQQGTDRAPISFGLKSLHLEGSKAAMISWKDPPGTVAAGDTRRCTCTGNAGAGS